MEPSPARPRRSNPLKGLVRAGIRRGLRHQGVRAVVAAELKRLGPTTVQAPTPSALPGLAEPFVDRHGAVHPLDPTLRDRLKPGWRVMLDPVAVAEPPNDEALRKRATNAQRVVGEARRLVETIAGKPLGGRILEIGCFDGSAAYELARIPGSAIVATDLARYYLVQRPGDPDTADLTGQQDWLAALRERARIVAGASPGSVEFLEDDITESALEPASFDAIVSFEVLEHVRRPRAALAAMARLLRPGGVIYHDYNSFFSAIGGHSLCTLDFPWGHARLDAGDFERYLVEKRPAEAEQANRFYTESLNRLTIGDLRADAAAAGLAVLAVLPWHDRARAAEVSPDVLAEVRRIYPAVTVEDLLATFIAFVAIA
jgi:SAM-dependent methyltransferase